MQQKLIFIGYFLFAIFSGFSISLSQIALGIAFIGILSLLYQQKLSIKESLLEKPFAVFAISGLFSLTNAVDLNRGISEMSKFLIILVFWIAYWPKITQETQEKILVTMAIFGALSSICGILKTAFFDLGTLRAKGFLATSMTFGECQAIYMILTLALLATGIENRLKRWLLLFAFFIQGGGLVLSFTRGAWIGFAAGFIILLLLDFKRFVPMLFSVLLMMALIAGMSSSFRTRLASMIFNRSSFMANTMESEFRFRIWQIGFDILQTNPVFGVGMNNIKPLYKERVRKLDIKRKEIHGHLHNTFMQILVMTGFFGFIAFCWLFVEIYKFCFLLSSEIPHPWQAKLAMFGPAIITTFLGSGLTEYTFGDEEVAMLFFFIYGIIANPYCSELSKTNLNIITEKQHEE